MIYRIDDTQPGRLPAWRKTELTASYGASAQVARFRHAQRNSAPRVRRIDNISSVHGLRASPYKSAYVAAKHGLEGLSKTIALEGGARGVTSNTICPAYVRTPLVEKQIADQARVHGIPEAEVVEKIMLTESAVKRLVEPAEVAGLAVFLCSPQMSFANGSSYVLDGGWTAR